jgi:hypothetical protein
MYGVDVNVTNKSGYTAFICAAKKGYVDVVVLLS